ncbi:hypothetical protein [Rhodopseudomonas palustris]|nr:hypothetical protein [Rhodopseudomonas palustris]
MIDKPPRTHLLIPKDIAIDDALLAVGIAAGLIGLIGLLLA